MVFKKPSAGRIQPARFNLPVPAVPSGAMNEHVMHIMDQRQLRGQGNAEVTSGFIATRPASGHCTLHDSPVLFAQKYTLQTERDLCSREGHHLERPDAIYRPLQFRTFKRRRWLRGMLFAIT
jgi:hypothetical protein